MENESISEAKELKDKKKETIKKEVISYVKLFVVAFAFVYILRTRFIILADVPTGSMENTIHKEDKVLGNRLAYEKSEPERGDVVIFHAPDEKGTLYIKRVIGLPGEKVVINEGKIYINDSEIPLEEDYLKEEWASGNGYYEYYVPVNAYFMLGDNRNRSFDARSWQNTYVTSDSIIAKAECIYFPFKDIRSFD